MLDTLRQAEDRWRRDVARLPFDAKVRQVIEMQRRLYPILAAKRELAWWERPWRFGE